MLWVSDQAHVGFSWSGTAVKLAGCVCAHDTCDTAQANHLPINALQCNAEQDM
jgi:hypothetical protein